MEEHPMEIVGILVISREGVGDISHAILDTTDLPAKGSTKCARAGHKTDNVLTPEATSAEFCGILTVE
jgi:hypothetical protein